MNLSLESLLRLVICSISLGVIINLLRWLVRATWKIDVSPREAGALGGATIGLLIMTRATNNFGTAAFIGGSVILSYFFLKVFKHSRMGQSKK